MATTRYSPEKDLLLPNTINGFPKIDTDLFENESLKGIEKAERMLHDLYQGSYYFYKFDTLIDKMRKPSVSPDIAWAYASCYISLDYFHNKISLPTKWLNKIFVKDKNQDKKTSYFQYYSKRLVASLGAQGTNLELLYLVFNAKPDQEKLDHFISRPILEELRKTSYFVEPRVEEISINSLNTQQWLRKQTLLNWQKLKAKLDKGKPWPVRLVDMDIQPAACYPHIAYDYIAHEHWVELKVHDPKCGKIKSWKFNTTEIGLKDKYEKEYANFKGIVCDNYQAVLPPMNVWRKLFFVWIIRFFFMVFKRLFNLKT